MLYKPFTRKGIPTSNAKFIQLYFTPKEYIFPKCLGTNSDVNAINCLICVEYVLGVI